MSERLVRVRIYESGEGENLGYAWGLLDEDAEDDNFIMFYTRSKRVAEEIGKGGGNDLYRDEIDTAISVDDCWTPTCVYVAAAKWALTGEL